VIRADSQFGPELVARTCEILSFLEDGGEAVMEAGIVGSQGDSAARLGDGLREAAQLHASEAEKEMGEGIVGAGDDGYVEGLLGLFVAARPVMREALYPIGLPDIRIQSVGAAQQDSRVGAVSGLHVLDPQITGGNAVQRGHLYAAAKQVVVVAPETGLTPSNQREGEEHRSGGPGEGGQASAGRFESVAAKVCGGRKAHAREQA